MTIGSLPPGPGLPGPMQAVLWGLRYPEFTRAAHARFGQTFTIRPGTMPPAVLTSDRDAVRRLLTGDPLAKAHGNDAVRPLIGERSVILLDPTEHLDRRKLLLPPFHGERVRDYAALLQRLTDDEIDRWSAGDIVALLPIAQNITIEVILQAVLGVAELKTRQRFRNLIDNVLFYPFGAGRSGSRSFRIAVPRLLRETFAFASSLFTPAVMTYFPETKARSRWNVATWGWWGHHDRLLALLDEHISTTRGDPRLAERGDVLAMLVQARSEHGEALSQDDLRDDLLTLIAAGHETTAAAIAWGAALLAHNPRERRRATAAAVEGDEAYLGALVREVLRLRPPIPVAAGRRLAEPFVIGSHTIPAGTLILIDGWGVHRDPDLYPDPERFDPGRFLSGSPEPYAWLPFGGGARRCIGAALAELEIRTALSTLLRRVTLGPADAELAPIARRAVTMVPYGGGRVRAERVTQRAGEPAPRS